MKRWVCFNLETKRNSNTTGCKNKQGRAGKWKETWGEKNDRDEISDLRWSQSRYRSIAKENPRGLVFKE